MLFDKKGALIAKSKVTFEPYFSIEEGYAEQYAEVYWDKIKEASVSLKAKYPAEWERVIAVSITTMRDNCVCVDKDGKVLRPVILWLDRREADDVKLPLKQKLLFSAIGMGEGLKMHARVSPCNWIRQKEPEVWANTYKYLMFSGYVNFLFTGKMLDSTANMIGHIPFDYKNRCWQKPSGLTYPVTPVETEKLCDLVEPGELIGYVTEKASAETGIPVGMPVIAAGSDKGCETLGTGCNGDGIASLSFGTTATIQFTTTKYVEPTPFMPAYPAMIKGKYNPETQIFRGYWMVTWFKNEFAAKEELKAKELGISSEVLLDKLLEVVPAGSDGLLLQPYWSPVLKAPEARGAVVGFSDKHTKGHLYRAIIEGIGYGLLEGLKTMEKRAKFNIKRLTVSGGGSGSDAICQITADMCGLPVSRVQTYETSGLGAAMVGFVGMNEFKDLDEARDNMVHYGDEFLPNPENYRVYSVTYDRIYKNMYKCVKPLYAEMRNVRNILKNKQENK
jgi:sugar (pentulose or hexulose) kinase